MIKHVFLFCFTRGFNFIWIPILLFNINTYIAYDKSIGASMDCKGPINFSNRFYDNKWIDYNYDIIGYFDNLKIANMTCKRNSTWQGTTHSHQYESQNLDDYIFSWSNSLSKEFQFLYFFEKKCYLIWRKFIA